jgi:hypothetical protein
MPSAAQLASVANAREAKSTYAAVRALDDPRQLSLRSARARRAAVARWPGHGV